VWGVLCLHLMGKMTTWIGPAMRVRNQNETLQVDLVFFDEARLLPGPSSCLRSVRLTMGTGRHTQASLRW